MENLQRVDPSYRRSSRGRRHSQTREDLLRFIEAQAAPVSTSALAQATGLHENTVRGHLEALLGDGYLVRSRDQTARRGRPAWLWQADASDDSSPYAALAAALAATLARTSTHAVHDAREAGRAWGRDLAAGRPPADDAQAAARTVVDIMREQGFAPHVGADAVLLRRCPLIEAATKHPQIVCSVHLGMIDGVLESVGHAGGDSTLAPLTSPGECTLHLRVAS